MDYDKEFANEIKKDCLFLYKVVLFFLKKIEDEKMDNNKNMKAIRWLLVFLNIPMWLIVIDVLVTKI